MIEDIRDGWSRNNHFLKKKSARMKHPHESAARWKRPILSPRRKKRTTLGETEKQNVFDLSTLPVKLIIINIFHEIQKWFNQIWIWM